MCELKNDRLKNPKNICLSYLNVNSIRNKVDDLFNLVGAYIDILAVGETKLDASFPDAQFCKPNFRKPFRLDKSQHQWGLMVYVRNNIPCCELSRHDLPNEIQLIPLEITLGKQRYVILAIYRPPSTNLSYFLNSLNDIVDKYYMSYDRIIILGDFNCEPTEKTMEEFLQNCELKNLIKNKTCFKAKEGTCIDLILTNCKSSFLKCNTIETGISDHHHLIYGILKAKSVKIPPKEIVYRCYKRFDVETFNTDLKTQLNLLSIKEYGIFQDTLLKVLDTHAPLKKKLIRGNSKPHITKELRKQIMKRSRLKGISNKTCAHRDVIAYKQQRNLVVKLNREQKQLYFNRINTTDPKCSLWKICKPFMGKGTVEDKVFLNVNGSIISDDQKVADIFIDYYSNITNDLNISQWEPCMSDCNVETDDPIENAINKHSSHPSILKINEICKDKPKFNFKKVSLLDIRSYIMKLNKRKKSSGNIPTRILQDTVDITAPYIKQFTDDMINTSIFPSSLKCADIRPIYKKGSVTEVKNYRPISLLPSASKVFERLLYDQIDSHFADIFSPILCGFRKGHSTQHALLNLLMKWQRSLDSRGVIAAVLMDLSKAYDCLSHELVISKLAAYGFSRASLKLIYSFLKNRKQRVKVGNKLSMWLAILLGIPQGSILGPIIFNIFINDLFLFLLETDVCNFADDNTLSACGETAEDVLNRVKADLARAIDWFKCNGLVANPEKFQFIMLGKNTQEFESIMVSDIVIKTSKSVKLLGVEIDKELNFDAQTLCITANNRTNALLRIRPYVTFHRKRDTIEFINNFIDK